VRRLLDELKPQGLVSDLAAQWEGPVDAPDKYDVKAALSGVSFDSRNAREAHDVGRPGLRNAAIDLHANEAGGDARISVANGAVDLPGVFAEQRVPLDQLSAALSWKVDHAKGAGAGAEPKLSVMVKDARFANPDAHGELTAAWSSGDSADKAHGGRFPGRLELDGKFSDGIATRIARYLPLGLPEATRKYVEAAVRGGVVKAATFRVKGHLRDFPFHNARRGKDGEFRITGLAEDATFAFVPDSNQWPALTKLSGELVIDRSTLEIRNAHALLGAIEWSGVQGKIPNLGDSPMLALDASARGQLADMIGVVNSTPIGGWIGKSLAATTATGPAELKLAMGIPLAAVSTTTVKGSLALTGNDVRITADTPLLAGAKGHVDFTQKGFSVVGASARVLGGDATFDGGTQTDEAIRFSGQGTATSDGLRRATELGLVARVATSLSGQAAYRFNLGFVHGRSQIFVSGNLQGMGVDLPYPLAKPASTPLELRYQTLPADEGQGTGAPRESLRLDVGSVLQVQYVRETSGDLSRVIRGGIGVFGPAPTPPAGVAASLNLQRLDVDAWDAAFDKLFSPVAAGAAAGPGAATGASAASNSSSNDGYVPGAVALRAQELQWGARRITGLVAGASETGGLWRVNVNADQLDGYVEFRPSRRRAGQAVDGSASPGPGRVFARLARLSLPKTDVAQVETLLEEQPATTVPGLDIVVDDFELRGKKLGRVEIEAANQLRRDPGKEPVREWRLSKMNVTLPEAKLTATGAWGAETGTSGATKGPRRASMDFKLAVTDSGALLERLGAGKAIRGGKGEMSGQVSWAGSPLSPDYPSMAGEINVAIDSGQFLKAEPGAARLLSVLSLQSLPRRLAFDFRDLFEEGFAFDSVTGDVDIADGVARTNNLRMRGPAAVVLMEGSADIAREKQDLRVVVVPEINAGTASLAVAIINPAVGIGTFLAQYFLRKPLIEAGTREFRISGPWDDPKIDRVDRKRSQSVSAAEPPPRAASTPNP
ncbi:MAG: YhdP family protein, partial [Caldimonas sp.]